MIPIAKEVHWDGFQAMFAKDVVLSDNIESGEILGRGSSYDQWWCDLQKLTTWKHNDFVQKYILSGLDNTLYNIYNPINFVKELWESFDKKKYKLEDVSSKKFVVDKFLDFKMIDSKTVMSQVQKLQIPSTLFRSLQLLKNYHMLEKPSKIIWSISERKWDLNISLSNWG